MGRLAPHGEESRLTRASRFIIIGLLVLAGAWAVKPGAPKRVDVPEGLSARQTAELLGAQGIVQLGSPGFVVVARFAAVAQQHGLPTISFLRAYARADEVIE